MIIHEIYVKNFRGIKRLAWENINTQLVALIGPCDSTKSTILKAIEYALYPGWQIPLHDTDFHNQNLEEDIEIQLTITDFPTYFIDEDKYGLYLRGITKEHKINDEPSQDDTPALTIKLVINNDLIPTWSVINDRKPEGSTFHAKDRIAISTFEIGNYVEKDLSWSKSSALVRLTGHLDQSERLLSTMSRGLKKSISTEILDEWSKECNSIEREASNLGFNSTNELSVHLDITGSHLKGGLLSIHDGNIPARLYGKGNKRLLTLAIQKQTSKDGAIIIIDEIENGLEPHRLRNLISKLRPTTNADGQVFFTTHATTSIVECKASEINIVRNNNGTIEIKNIPMELQAIVRSCPDAFFGKRILVCEGATEYGFIRSLDNYMSKFNQPPFAHLGVICVNGAGTSQAAGRARDFKLLGFDVCFFADSDVIPSPNTSELEKLGIKIVQWTGKNATEEIIFSYCDLECVEDIFKYIKTNSNQQSIQTLLQSDLNKKIASIDNLEIIMKDNNITEKDLRQSLGKIAKGNGWLKRIDHGEIIGDIIMKSIKPHEKREDTNEIYSKILKLNKWIYQ